VQLGALGLIDPMILAIGGGLAVLAFAVHFVLRAVASAADPFLLPIATVLNGLGIAMIYRIDIADKHTGWDSASVRQIVWSSIAILCAIGVMLIIRNHRVLFRYNHPKTHTECLPEGNLAISCPNTNVLYPPPLLRISHPFRPLTVLLLKTLTGTMLCLMNLMP
jgi:hypothetical protein